jgi:peptidylprolyl isomerase
MASATRGDTVRIHYTGRLDDGKVFDSSVGRQPLEFKLGSGQVIGGFDSAITGMEAGQEREELLLRVPRSDLPDGFDPQVGRQIQVSTPDGQTIQATVARADEEGLLLDVNHPLAGRDLTFDIQLVSVT